MIAIIRKKSGERQKRQVKNQFELAEYLIENGDCELEQVDNIQLPKNFGRDKTLNFLWSRKKR